MKLKLLLLAIVFSITGIAQDDLLSELEEESDQSPEKVLASFKSSYLINAQTDMTMRKRQLDFRITHRFGNMFDGNGGHTLLGIDQASNIRFSFDYGITDDLQIGVGRSKLNEHIDGSIKYKLLHQKTKGMPISLTLYAQTAYTPKKDLNDEFSNQIDRFSFAYQAVITSKINSSISLGLLPTYLHRNSILEYTNSTNGAKETNDLLSVGFTGRVRLTRRFAIIGEYFYTFSKFRTDNPDFVYYMPLSLGIEIETGGHVFHINYSNSPGIIYNDFITNSSESWLKGQVKLGFNISRVFDI